MDRSGIEGAARQIYELAGLDMDRPVWLPKLAVKLLGEGCIERTTHWKMRVDGALVRVNGKYRIFVRKGLPLERIAHVVGHELGHWLCQRNGYNAPDIEQVCDAIGAALVAPRPAFQVAARALGPDDLPGLAKAFGATQSLVALRGGEVTGRPMALIAPRTVRVRGDHYTWPDAAAIREMAQARRPGLQRTRLTDDNRRTLLAAR